MNKEKLKKFVNEHKTEMIVTGGIAIGVLLSAVGVKKMKLWNTTGELPNLKNDVKIPENFSVGKVVDLWNEGRYLNTIVDKITVKDIGRLGEEFIKHGLVTDNATVDIIIGFD